MSNAYAYIVRRVLTIALALVSSIYAAPAALAQSGCGHGGFAVGGILHLEGERTLLFAHSGFVPPQGGTRSNSLQSAEEPGVYQATSMSTFASGTACVVTSSASQGDVILLPGSVSEIRASSVEVQARAECGGTSAEATVNDLTIGGVPVVLTGEPNQVVPIPGVGTLVVDERTPGEDGSESIVVRGMRLLLESGDTVVVSEAQASVACPVPSASETWGRVKSLYR